MKIALLTNGIYPYVIGGIQKHSYYLAKGFAKRGIYVDVYHLKTDVNCLLTDYFTKEEIEYINFYENPFPSIPTFPGHYIVANYMHSKHLYHQLSKKEYDFIYAQGFTSWYFVKNNFLSDKIISNLHGLEMFQHTINFKNALHSFLLRIPAKTIIKQSKFQISLGGKLTNILIKNGANTESVFKLPNAIDETWLVNKEFINQNNNKPIQFTFIGRNERRKGIVEIKQVLQNLIKQNFNFHFNFVGLESQEVNLNTDNVKCYGVIRNEEKIKKILDATDVLVCPSYSEGMPTVILEAMARGCAIIATDVGAVSEMVSSDNGRLIDKNYIAKDLEQAMRYYTDIEASILKQQKQQSMLKVKAQFTWEQAITQTIDKLNLYLN